MHTEALWCRAARRERGHANGRAEQVREATKQQTQQQKESPPPSLSRLHQARQNTHQQRKSPLPPSVVLLVFSGGFTEPREGRRRMCGARERIERWARKKSLTVHVRETVTVEGQRAPRPRQRDGEIREEWGRLFTGSSEHGRCGGRGSINKNRKEITCQGGEL